MKKIVVLCLALGMAFSFAMCGQSAHTQSITPQRGLVGATTGGGLVVSGNKLGLFPCAAGQAPVSNGTSWACGDTTPPDNSVTLAKLADIATARILGRTTAGTGDPEALTGAQATALLDTVTTSNKGLVPTAPNDTTKFLRGDGTWAVLQGWSSMFGSGVDGDVTFDGAATVLGFAPSSNTYTVTRDISVDHMVISSGVTVFAHGVRVFSKSGISGTGTLSVRGNDGGNATGSTVSGAAGAAIADRTFKGVSAGVVGGSATPSANSSNAPLGISLTLPAELQPASNGANGLVGTGGVGGSGGGATGGAAGVTMVAPGTVTRMTTANGGPLLDAPPALSTGRALAGTQYTWGTAGTAGRAGNGSQPGRGGGSGTAGGAIYIAALTITGITIDARGGNGGNGGNATGGFGGGGGAGAGGGSGGIVLLVQGYGTLPTIDISGGTGGLGAAGDPGPVAGSSGFAGGNGGQGLKFAYVLVP
jgi:hypothetical protein